MTSAVRLTGVAGAPGIAIGPVWRFDAAESAPGAAAGRPLSGQRPAASIASAGRWPDSSTRSRAACAISGGSTSRPSSTRSR